MYDIMKKFVVILLSVVVGWPVLSAQNYKEVTNETPGQLETLLGSDWKELDSLVVRGAINAEDILAINEYAENLKWRVIDLWEADIADKTIPQFGLAYNHYIERVILPDDIRKLEMGAFTNTQMMKTVNIPASLEVLSVSAFDSCLGLEGSISIPDGVTEIGDGCFMGCFLVSHYDLPARLESIGENTFMGCFGITGIELPSTLRSIGVSAFEDCYGLVTVSVPGGVEYLSDYCFSSCSELKTVSLHPGLKTIGVGAFIRTALETVTLPSTVETIKHDAFKNISQLKSVYSMAVVPPVLEPNPAINHFDNPFGESVSEYTLYVPEGCGNAYRSATGWRDFGNIVETDDFPYSVEDAGGDAVTVAGGVGLISVSGLNACEVTVYTADGRCVATRLVDGAADITVPAGMYAVVAGGRTYKVIVR